MTQPGGPEDRPRFCIKCAHIQLAVLLFLALSFAWTLFDGSTEREVSPAAEAALEQQDARRTAADNGQPP